MSRICLCLTAQTLNEDRIIYQRYAEKVDLFELRVDFLQYESPRDIADFVDEMALPVIVTCRRPEDGGVWEKSEEERLAFLQLILKVSPAWVDLEGDVSSVWEDKYVPSQTGIIRSFHDFENTPNDLASRMKALKKRDGDLLKAAVMPKTAEDNLRLWKASLEMKQSGGDFILLGMGPSGFWTRVLAARMGSYLTFTSPEGTLAAPGHCSPEMLIDLYRFSSLKVHSDPVYGITGNPLGHTRSPSIHNHWLTRDSKPGVYFPFPVETMGQELLEWCHSTGIKGFSVTVPFKEDIIPLLDQVSDAVRQIGACNTVYRRGEHWLGENTDWQGFLIPLKKQFGTVKDKKVSVIGAGGAARAAVYALRQEGAEILILNRTLERAETLAAEFKVKAAPLNAASIHLLEEFSDLIVQTGSAGMAGKLELIDPIDFYPFSGNEIVYDIVYNPEKTVLLARAEKAGCRILNGYPMLEAQAEGQYTLFTGR